ncbi:MAG: hypothetical protein ACR2GQ_07150 [Gemmatimonadota bacterium]
MRHRRLTIFASLLLALVAIPTVIQAQEYPRSAVDEALDQLATERAQALNAAYYEYETRLDEARQEAQHAAEPSLYETRRTEYRANLEEKVLRIERTYEQRRADILYAEDGDRPEMREVAGRFDPPSTDISATTERNDELALAWADFNEAAETAHDAAQSTGDWSNYEATLTELEREYQETIAAIERRHREQRFQEMRRRYSRPDSDR